MNDGLITRQLQKMREDWDRRARENARYYVATGQEQWSDDDFFRSGEDTVGEQILNDLENICGGGGIPEICACSKSGVAPAV